MVDDKENKENKEDKNEISDKINKAKSDLNFTPETLSRWQRFEGYSINFYLDGAGYVTIGIGCVIPDTLAATQLNLLRKLNNTEAAIHEKFDDFNIVKKAIPDRSLVYYAKITKLYLPNSDIIKLFSFRLDFMVDFLRRQLPIYDSLPNEVREVLKDMAFNLGITGLIIKFPKLIKAIEKRDFKAAAYECFRLKIQEERNNWAFDTLFHAQDINLT